MSFLLGEFCKIKRDTKVLIQTERGGIWQDAAAKTKVIIIELFDDFPNAVRVLDNDDRRYLICKSKLESAIKSIQPKKELYNTIW